VNDREELLELLVCRQVLEALGQVVDVRGDLFVIHLDSFVRTECVGRREWDVYSDELMWRDDDQLDLAVVNDPCPFRGYSETHVMLGLEEVLDFEGGYVEGDDVLTLVVGIVLDLIAVVRVQA
jgi:hypothetical protein